VAGEIFEGLAFLKLALAKQQHHSMYALFQEFPKLKKEFKPLYLCVDDTYER